MPFGLLAAFVLVQASAPSVATRSFCASFSDGKGAPLRDLTRDEVVVLENGIARDLTEFSLDARPLTAAVLVDTSESLGSVYRLSLVDAVSSFVRKLPEDSRYAIWITGDRPRKIVDYTTDRERAYRALRHVAPMGGNTMLDAMVEAAPDLVQVRKEGDRSLLVVVTGLGEQSSFHEPHTVIDMVKQTAVGVCAVQFEEAWMSLRDRPAYEIVLSRLTETTGGVYESALSSMGVDSRLRNVLTDLSARYRLIYLTGGTKAPKLEVKVARPQVKVRIGQPRDER